MSVASGKALWSIICGQSVLASDEVVGEELEDAAEHLREGLSFYKNWSEEDHKKWESKSELKKRQKEFVNKVGKMLDLCSEQAWKIFQLFLQHEYRGSSSQLHAAASSDRDETMLMHQVFNFYLSDPLHLLSCRRHILAADSSHPYQKLFKEFVTKVLDSDHSLGCKLVSQLKLMKLKSATAVKDSPSPYLPPNAYPARIAHHLSAIKHQLATLLIYHGTPGRPCPPDSVRILLQLAQGSGIGRDFLENDSHIERSSFGLQLEAIDAFHSFLLTLIINADSDPRSHPLCTPEWIKKLNPLVFSLGSKPWHYPPLLAWAILQGRRVANDSGNSEEAAKYSRLAQRAIKGNAFQYLQVALKTTAFETDHLLLVMGSSVTYSLLCIVGVCLDLEKLGLTTQADELAKVCLSFDPPSNLFWNEEGGGASVLLPSALECFPHNPHFLLDIATSLASANEFSSGKVVELLKDLESFTWPLIGISPLSVSISGSQCISRESLQFLPGMTIPMGSHALVLNGSPSAPPLIVCWQVPVNGWQVLLSAFKSLQTQIESGISVEKWYLETVVSGLRLMSAVIRSNKQHLQLFVHLHEVSQSLLMSGSQVLKPNYDLISALLEFFAEVAKSNCAMVWSDLEGCPLLPSLPAPKFVKKQTGIDLLVNYRAGNIRSLICGSEAATGSFSILKHLCCLLESALKVGLRHNNVRGTLVFIVKEVVPVMLQWRYCNVAERVAVNEGTFSLLHHSLEEGCIDPEMQQLVVSELSSTVGGAGATLRAVLEGGSNLEAALDQPAEWPHSSHASKLTKMAQLALSVTHRLVGQYITWSTISGKNLNEFFLGGSLHPNNSVGANASAWVSPRPSHLALTIAHFVHHRLNPRLPYLALRTLTRLAKELGMPLVACLGSEAEGVRDCLLTRLDSSTEDIWVKVALLKLLTTSTRYQPGLIRLFLTPPAPLLDSVVCLVQLNKEGKTEASAELLSALIEMVASLWEGNFATATNYLREQGAFWKGLSYCLCSKTPGSFKDDLVGNIFRIFTLEYFGAQIQICEKLDKTMKEFIDPKKDSFKTWFKHIFVASVEKETDITDSEKATPSEDHAPSSVLLTSSCEFLVVLLTRTKTLLSDNQKIYLGEKVIEGLLNLFESGSDGLEHLRILLAEMHLTIVQHCGKILVQSENYTSTLTRLLGSLRCSVMQTKANCQSLILAGALKSLMSITNNKAAAELSSLLVNAATLLVEQHCSLASSFSANSENSSKQKNFECSSPLTLALSCALLHQCLLTLSSEKIETLLEQSNVVYSLLQAATKHTEDSNAFVVKEILRLLSLLGRQSRCPNDLTTQNLAMSVSLVLSSQPKIDQSILCDLIWCSIWCLKREGASGIEGAVSLAAIHLSDLTGALTSSNTQPELALAAASLIVTLAPHHQLWRVIHPQCFEQMIAAAACCIHYTTKMLHLKETLEREASGEPQELTKSVSENSHSGGLSPSTISLINHLLQVLCTCLHAIRFLSPDIVELLCCPGLDLDPWNVTLIQPTSRKLTTGHPGTLPNLATLADILDLYHIVMPKDGKNPLSIKGGDKVINMSLLTQCAEEALVLLLSYSALFLMSSDVQPREARDIRTFLADETSSFFSHWMGRKSVASPLPPLSPGLTPPNLPFFMLCRQIVSSLCNSQKS